MFKFLRPSREQQTVQEHSPRSPLLYGANSNDMPENTSKSFNSIGMENLSSIAANMLPTDGTSNHVPAVPDIFMRDFNLAENIEMGDPCAFDEWFGFFCALLLSKKGCIQTQTYERSDLENADNLFKRALGAEMTARSIEKLTVYKKADVTLGYAYDGMKTLVCPAAKISEDVTESLFSGCMNNGKFVNPIEILKQSAYASQARRVALELEARQHDLANQTVLFKKLQEYIEILKNRIPGEELNPFWADSGITIPGTKAEQPEQTETARMLNSWLEDYIVVFQYEEKRFNGCHGVFNVKNEAGKTEEQVIVPFNQTFAQMISTQRFGQRNNGLMSAGEWIQWLDRKMDRKMDRKTEEDNESENSNQTAQQIYVSSYTMAEDKCTYRIDITYQEKLYSKYYDTDHVKRNSMLCMPIVAAWPKTRDDTRAWKDYYLYVRQIDKEGAVTSKGIELTVLEPDENDGSLSLKKSTFDRDEKNGKHDWVTHTHDFPQFVQVTYNQQNVGVLFPKSQGTLTRPADKTCIIAIDFGSTNTIAYRKMPNEIAEPLNIGQTAGVICEREMEPNSEEWTNMTLDFFNPSGWNQPLFLTILKIHGIHDARLNEVLPLEEGSIPFTKKITITYSMQSRLITDELKWNRKLEANIEPIRIARTRGYLKMIMMMYKWSAYKDGADLEQIKWRFAYPRSMSQSARKALIDVFKGFASPNEVKYTSEANAAGSFLQDDTLNGVLRDKFYDPLKVKDPCMLIDIGGGTVDYSLWQNNKLATEASMIGVAGDFALRSAILHDDQADVSPNVELLRQLFPVNPDEEKNIDRIKNNLGKQLTNGNQAVEATTGTVSEKLIAYMEARKDPSNAGHVSTINNMFKQLWTTNINDICESMKEKLPSLTQGAAIQRYAKRLKLYYALLLYFAGELAGAAMNENKLECTGCFNIGLIGNGAKSVMNLMNERESFAKSELNQMLQHFFITGIENTYGGQVQGIKVQIIEPIKAKHEVAMGLCMRDFTNEEEKEAVLQWTSDTNPEGVKQVVGNIADCLYGEDQIRSDDPQNMETWTVEGLKQRMNQAVDQTENTIDHNPNSEVWKRKDTIMAEIIRTALNSD